MKKKTVSKAKQADLTVAPAWAKRRMQMQGLHVSDGVDALMAGGVEAFLYLFLDLCVKQARECNVRRIAPKHISDVLHNDKALAKQLVPGGILPKGRWHLNTGQTGWSDKRKEEEEKKEEKEEPAPKKKKVKKVVVEGAKS
jgi:hypothetical protein